ncbi:MAG TPA: hypothetical protein VE760_01590 [Acidimicrobiales bacterium]|nr:hypothetical protein [Acidimicrobiales bacterium]
MFQGSMVAVSPGWTWESWLWLVVPVAFYCVVTLFLFAFGRADERGSLAGFFFRQVADSLERATGFPGWAMAGALTGLLMLGIAVMGFYWDVAWHIDLGRDKDLFTPSHVMILVGLGGLFFSALVTILFASIEGVPTRFGAGPVRVPLPAVLLTVFGIGGVSAFPLDALWHDAYGVDVTLWSPTHLQLMTGGALATLAVWLLLGQALPWARPNLLGKGIHALAAGAALTGLSIYQGEFDFGGPQFQVVYLPILIAAAAGFVLVLARLALGRWGAVKAVVAFLVLRVLLGLMIGGALDHTYPRFPLYLPSALLVEAAAAWVGTRRRLHFGLVAGALVGTVGMVAEMTWVGVTGGASTGLPLATVAEAVVLSALAGMGAAVLGAGLGRAFVKIPAPDDGDRRSVAGAGVPIAALTLAGVAVIGALAFPLPRRVGNVDATIALERQGDQALVDVALRPSDAADDAIAFTVTAWQGGGTRHAHLHRVGPGHYRTDEAVPVTGSWKAMVSLLRGDQVMAAPVYLPADAEIGAPEIPAVPVRDVAFVRNTKLLLREQHPGPAWPAMLAYTGLAVLVAVFVALIAYTAVRVSRREDAGPRQGWDPRGPRRPVEPAGSVPERSGGAPVTNGTGAYPPVTAGWYRAEH